MNTLAPLDLDADTRDAIDIAALIARGWHVFAIDSPETDKCSGIGKDHDPATCDQRGKHPAVKWSTAASSDMRDVAHQFVATGPRNVGVACGPSGLIVLDEDTLYGLTKYAADHGHQIPDTRIISTGRGRHFYFLAPDGLELGNHAGALRDYGVDVRGAGGYVIGEGSLHASGALYTVDDDRDPAPLPQWAIDAVQARPAPRNGAQDGTEARGLARVPETIRGPRQDAPGERQDVLMRYASSMLARYVPADEAEVLFHAAWARCEQPPACPDALTWETARDSILHDIYGRYEPGPSEAYAPLDLGSGGEGAGSDGDGPLSSSWAPLDIAATITGLLDGTVTRHAPDLGAREDLAHLFYAGKVNGIAGSSGSGKSWTGMLVCAQQIAAGHAAAYIDLEDDVVGTVGRMLDLGADPDDLRERFLYLHPDEAYGPVANDELSNLIRTHNPTVMVIDSTGESMAQDGAKPNDDDDVARWFKRLPTAVANAGPGVIVLDHVTKSDEGGLWPIGSQRKRAAISGAQYMQAVVRPFAKGQPGMARLVCAKDRHGNYRPDQRVADLIVTPDGDGVSIVLRAPNDAATSTAETFRPTALMERISNAITAAGEPLSGRGITDRVTGKREHVARAIDQLAAEGHVTRTEGAKRSTMHTLDKPYRQADDPRSDTYLPPFDGRVGECAPSLERGVGHTHSTAHGTHAGHTGAHTPDPLDSNENPGAHTQDALNGEKFSASPVRPAPKTPTEADRSTT